MIARFTQEQSITLKEIEKEKIKQFEAEIGRKLMDVEDPKLDVKF